MKDIFKPTYPLIADPLITQENAMKSTQTIIRELKHLKEIYISNRDPKTRKLVLGRARLLNWALEERQKKHPPQLYQALEEGLGV